MNRRPFRRVGRLAIAGVLVAVTINPAVAMSSRGRGREARTTSISETSSLHLVAHQGTKILHEEGQVSGTLHGHLVVTINIGYTQATVTFAARSSTGTLSGRGVESYYVAGKNGHFNGRMTVTGGTGSYARAVGSNLQTSGLIKRAHYEVAMSVDGQLKS